MTLLTVKAQTIALLAHVGQAYGNRPFIEHPRDVAKIAKEYSLGEHIIAAAWLHDTMEDCPVVTFNYLEQTFGLEIAGLVHAVTDEVGKNRRERAKKTLPKIRQYGYPAVALKLCDRLSNVEASIRDKSPLLYMYKKEHATFKEFLHKKGELEEVWERLDNLLKEEKCHQK